MAEKFVTEQTCKVCYKGFNGRLTRIEVATYLILVSIITKFFH